MAATRGLRGKIRRFLLQGLRLGSTRGRLFRGEMRFGLRWRHCVAVWFRGGRSLCGRGRLSAHSSAELRKKTLLRSGRDLGLGTWCLRGSGAAFAMLLLGLGFGVSTSLGPRLGTRFLAVGGIIGAATPRSVHLNIMCAVLPHAVTDLSRVIRKSSRHRWPGKSARQPIGCDAFRKSENSPCHWSLKEEETHETVS